MAIYLRAYVDCGGRHLPISACVSTEVFNAVSAITLTAPSEPNKGLSDEKRLFTIWGGEKMKFVRVLPLLLAMSYGQRVVTKSRVWDLWKRKFFQSFSFLLVEFCAWFCEVGKWVFLFFWHHHLDKVLLPKRISLEQKWKWKFCSFLLAPPSEQKWKWYVLFLLAKLCKQRTFVKWVVTNKGWEVSPSLQPQNQTLSQKPSSGRLSTISSERLLPSSAISRRWTSWDHNSWSGRRR